MNLTSNQFNVILVLFFFIKIECNVSFTSAKTQSGTFQR